MKFVVERMRAFFRLSAAERTIVLEATAALCFTWLGLRLVGFRRWSMILRRMANPPSPAVHSASMLPAAEVIARMEAAAARNLFHANCLERSMVLWWLLSSRGISSELRIGAQKSPGKFEAHAWVECERVILNNVDDIHSHFVPFDGPLTSPETSAP